jgi:hypothetical protein
MLCCTVLYCAVLCCAVRLRCCGAAVLRCCGAAVLRCCDAHSLHRRRRVPPTPLALCGACHHCVCGTVVLLRPHCAHTPRTPRSEDLERAIRNAAAQRHLAADDSFVVSVVRLAEVLAIRHCVFIMGPAGSGKTEVWRTLAAAWDLMHKPVTVRDLNPKVRGDGGFVCSVCVCGCLFCAVLCCAVLSCAVLCCAVQYCAVLCCAVLRCADVCWCACRIDCVSVLQRKRVLVLLRTVCVRKPHGPSSLALLGGG